MIPNDKINEIKDYIDKAENPLFMFDDDPDGLCSYLVLNKLKERGRYVIIKASPKLDVDYSYKIKEYSPDLVVILDKPIVSQEFINDVHVPVVWLDHHPIVNRKGVHYYNPRINDKNDTRCTTYWAYQINKQENALWIATVGCVSDWFVPDFIEEFSEKYPNLLPKNIKDVEEILFKTKLGVLSNIFSFMLKGKSIDIKQSINVLKKIESPYEILNQESSRGKFIYKRYELINKQYQKLLNEALKNVTKEKILVFIYKDAQISFTSNLSNELIVKYPDKIIIVGRVKSGDVKMSLRSKRIILPGLIEKALENVRGYGGGHDFASGANVKEEDFDRFIENLKDLLKTKD